MNARYTDETSKKYLSMQFYLKSLQGETRCNGYEPITSEQCDSEPRVIKGIGTSSLFSLPDHSF